MKNFFIFFFVLINMIHFLKKLKAILKDDNKDAKNFEIKTKNNVEYQIAAKVFI